MKRLARIAPVFALALVLGVAAHAQTADPGQKSKLVVPPKPLPLVLRGLQKAPPPLKLAPPAPSSATASAAPADPGECRAACAHTYYFCLSGDGAPDCPQSWTSCLAACENATLASR